MTILCIRGTITVITKIVQSLCNYNTEERGGALLYSINYRDSRPIYEQVKDNLRRAILTGVIESDEKIPSVREMAGKLAINPNTIQKAYRELEAEGYIYSVPGKGSFANDTGGVRNNRKLELYEKLDKNVDELITIGVQVNEICEHIKQRGKETRND